MGLALLTLGLLTPAQAQTTEWVRTRCNADGSPDRGAVVTGGNAADNSLHGPVTTAFHNTYTSQMAVHATPLSLSVSHDPSVLNDDFLYPPWDFDSSMWDPALNLGMPGVNPYLYATNASNSTVNTVGSLSAHVDGKLRAYFHWTTPVGFFGPYTPAAPLPPYMDFLVTTTLSASWSARSDAVVDPSLLSAVVSASDTTFQEWVGYPTPLTAWVGRHLVRATVPGNGTGVALVEVDGAADAVLTNLVPQHGFDPVTHAVVSTNNAQVCADFKVAATAVPDTRAVTISADVDGPNDSTPTSYKLFIGGVDANGDGLVAIKPHLRDPDGTMRGDIGLNFRDPSLLWNDPWNLQQVTYHANRLGNWLPYDSQDWWNSSLKNYSCNEFLNMGACNISDFTNLYNKPMDLSPNGDPPGTVINPCDTNPSINPDHIHVTYQNGDDTIPVNPLNHPQSDHAVATANYYMTVHLADEVFRSNKQPYDHFYDANSDPSHIDMNFVVDGNPAYALSGGGGVTCTWDPPGVLWQYASVPFTVLSHAPWPEGGWIGLGLAAVGIGVDKLNDQFGPHAHSQNVTFGYNSWDGSYAFFQGYPDPVTGATRPPLTKDFPSTPPHALDDELAKWHMVPHLRVGYTTKWILKDHYDKKTGFTGEALIPFDIYNGQEQFYGEFRKNNLNSGP